MRDDSARSVLPGDEAARTFTNRLIGETSPYLLQHAHNPVDWYPWGDEAFARARSDDRPILLSIGYAACHWCHVMAHESFENGETARLINEHFVAIKVDREERPDVDGLYMDAVVALTGNGGWPMTVFLTADGAPFYGGTYFPPVDRYGMPGFPRLLRRLAELWSTRRAEVERQAAEFREFYQQRSTAQIQPIGDVDGDALDLNERSLAEAAKGLLDQIDATNGGFGGAPKFPHPMALEFLLRMASRRAGSTLGDADDGLRLVRLTLDRMADGGIYDQVGGGFHRYSTDAHWLVPHFEKMLYDNALLAPVYLHAWQLTGEPRYRRVCEETLDYVLREMTDASGGFYSTQDADSEGEEGRFYVWTTVELREALGEDDARIAERIWGVTERGNFEGRNILHRARSEEGVAAELGIDEAAVAPALMRARKRLYATRSERVWPGRDEKVIAAWNGYMQRAFAEAGRVLDRDDYRRAAVANAEFLLAQMASEGRLLRTWRDGRAKIDAFLEDYGAVVNALLTTYEASAEPRLFAAATELAARMLDRFWDAEAGTFYDTARDAEALIGRPRELTDNATPSGTSLAVEALIRLSAFTGEGRWADVAARVLALLGGAAIRQPSAFGHLLCAVDDRVGPLYEVAIVGPREERRALERSVAGRYLPRMALAVGESSATEQPTVPLLANRPMVGGDAAAYVCQGFVCKRPVTRTEDLLALLQLQ
jgi:uncharacterized protein